MSKKIYEDVNNHFITQFTKLTKSIDEKLEDLNLENLDIIDN
jgi:hypothetical protein